MTAAGVGSEMRGETGTHQFLLFMRSAWLTAGGAWDRHHALLRNASSLIATTAITSLLGFGYWTFAAHLFSREAVGYSSASISAMTLLGTIGMLGLGTVLIGELPQRREGGGLVAASLLAAGIGSLILGLGFAIIAPHADARFSNITGTPGEAAVFTVGVVLTGVTMVFDQATIGAMRGGKQLFRNVVFSVVKLPALVGIAFLLRDQLGMGITLTWVVGMAASLLAVGVWMRIGGTRILHRPDWGVLRGLGTTALAHSWLNIAIMLPFASIPVLVTVVVSPSANAAFYASWTLVGFLKIIPTHLSTVLFAVAAAQPKSIAHKLRFTMRIALLVGVPGMICLGLGAHLALSMFGGSYARAATVPLMLLVASYLPGIPRAHYVAVCRASGNIPRAAAVLTVTALAEMAATVIGGLEGGLVGLSLALLAVYTAEGILTAPSVFRAAWGRGRHRRDDMALENAKYAEDVARGHDGNVTNDPRGPKRSLVTSQSKPFIIAANHDSEAREYNRSAAQAEGMATLLSLARTVALATGPIPITFEEYPSYNRGADVRKSGSERQADRISFPRKRRTDHCNAPGDARENP